MTIAACLLTPGGAVLGADSTQTFIMRDGAGNLSVHYFNHAQKLFEIGEKSTLGVITWGLGAFDGLSYRRFFADLGDEVAGTSPATVGVVMESFINRFWQKYSALGSLFAQGRAEAMRLAAIPQPTPQEQQQLNQLRQRLQVGFCLGGYTAADRTPAAYSVVFSPETASPPAPTQLAVGFPYFWGVKNLLERVINGIDLQLADRILKSAHWKGNATDLQAIMQPFALSLAQDLPIREAIDYMHSAITMTSKGLKFSQFDPVCGGPVEIAVITADRRFRWVKHKDMAQALS